MSGGDDGKDVDDKEDKDPGVVERERQVQEDGLQDSLRGVVLLQAVVDVGDTAGGEQQRNQGKDGVTLDLIGGEGESEFSSLFAFELHRKPNPPSSQPFLEIFLTHRTRLRISKRILLLPTRRRHLAVAAAHSFRPHQYM